LIGDSLTKAARLRPGGYYLPGATGRLCAGRDGTRRARRMWVSTSQPV